MIYLYLYIIGFFLSLAGVWFMNQLEIKSYPDYAELMPFAGAFLFSLVWFLLWPIWGIMWGFNRLNELWTKQVLFKPSQKKLKCKEKVPCRSH